MYAVYSNRKARTTPTARSKVRISAIGEVAGYIGMYHKNLPTLTVIILMSMKPLLQLRFVSLAIRGRTGYLVFRTFAF